MASTQLAKDEALTWLRDLSPPEPAHFLTISGLILSKEDWDALDDASIIALLETIVAET